MFTILYITLNGICKMVSIFTTKNVWIGRRWQRTELLHFYFLLLHFHRHYLPSHSSIFRFFAENKQVIWNHWRNWRKCYFFLYLLCLSWHWTTTIMNLNGLISFIKETSFIWRGAAFTCRVYAFTKKKKWFVHIDNGFWWSYFRSDIE